MATKRIFIDRELLCHLYHDEHLGIDAIALRLKTSHGTVWRALDAFGIPRRTLSEAITKHRRFDFSGDLLEKAYLIGLQIGDLWVRKNKPGIGSKTIVVSCHSTKQEQIDLIQSLFQCYGHVRITRSAESQQILCYLNSSFEFLLPKEDVIPEWILQHRSFFLAFLGGYLDAEGSFCIDRFGHAVFQLKSYDFGILKTIAHYLTTKFEIICHPPRLAQKSGTKTGKGYKLNGNAWKIAIGSRKRLMLFGKLILPYLRHAKRKGDVTKVLESLGSRN